LNESEQLQHEQVQSQEQQETGQMIE